MPDPHRYLASLQPLAMRLGLERMERALEALGHPERAYRVVHVAGTNGKGSTCAMVARALVTAGHRTGLYTSPHLVRFNERIAVDDQPIRDEELERVAAEVRRACPWHDAGDEAERLTYFEFATLMALLHFAERAVGVAVLEVGLGGRFDATNVVRPVLCAIARIGLDHVEMLGDTLSAIAREKAGILKPGVPAVVTDAQPAEALATVRAEAQRRGAPLTVAAATYPGPIALPGPHQQENAALAAAVLRRLPGLGIAMPEEATADGIARARWPGRLETVGGVLLDGAHNVDGATALAAALRALHPGRKVHLVFGVLSDKDHAGMLRALSGAVESLHLVAPRSPRGRPAATYRDLARALVGRTDEHGDVAAALACVRAVAAADDGLGAVAGSLYLVGEARQLLAREAAP
jgi:dihydrofolate synthase/folylpolyglutamate synthase